MAYANGAVPDELLIPIATGGRDLLLNPALSWQRLGNEMMRKYGWRTEPAQGATAYRSHEQQVRLFKDYYTTTNTGYGPPKAFEGNLWWRKTKYTPNAATPGTSNHGWGNAVDVYNVGGLGDFTKPRYKQLAATAGPFGWNNREGTNIDEPWHWVYVEANDTFIGSIVDEDEMDQATFNSLMTGFLTSSAGKKVLNDGTTGAGAYYQTTNPLTGDVESIIKNLTDSYSYVLKNFALLNQIKLALGQAAGVDVDEEAIAKDVAKLVIPATVAAVSAAFANVDTLTEAEVQAATEEALRKVLGSLG